MEVDRTFGSCFPDLIVDPSADHEPSLKKSTPCSSNDVAAPAKACFDCNICLDFAAAPVVTLCGHLYCWPCIYRWLHLDTAGIAGHGHRQCPVCKTPLSESFLVPLYGCGLDAKSHVRHLDIPGRPKEHQSLFSSAAAVDRHRPPPPPPPSSPSPSPYQNYPRENHTGVLHSTAGVVLGEMAFAILPWAFGNRQDFFASLYLSPSAAAVSSGRPSWRRREQMAESWLHQLWVFLFCFAVLFLFFL
ncbi:E3 ubiquitin-protein ligase RMA1 [Apostasia shenzhenica]|uniref:E3 ubiquitin-protein ligase RMA n=1 Tax=Apostasia shenzhenica TaxID=1088818 RepID=A0A2I0ATG6_9ASPA|nr:E3 ubiquitin-protein ligase RMA1 [Apostasia shenzhenica]